MNTLVLFDIDDTLIKDNQYPKNFDRIHDLIQNLEDSGYIFGLCTFRPFDDNVRKIYSDYGLNGPIITEGGACITNENDGVYSTTLYDNTKSVDLNKHIQSYLLDYAKDNDMDIDVLITKDFNLNNSIMINRDRVASPTIRVSEDLIDIVDSVLDYLCCIPELSYLNISKDNFNPLKLRTNLSGINKIYTIERFAVDGSVIFVSDCESDLPPHSDNIIVYSVGEDKYFNEYSDEVFPPYSQGVEDILLKIKGEM